MELLSQVKILLGIADTDTSKDDILNHVISLVEGLALRYCRLDAATADLDTVLADMAVGRYRVNGYGGESLPQRISEVSEGNVDIHFEHMSNAPMPYIPSNELTDGEKTMLKPFRKLWN